jgi:hypothetical protein
MSDVRARLGNALREHRPLRQQDKCVCGSEFIGFDEHRADVLLSLPGIAIVQLPAPDSDGEWDGQDDHVGWWASTGRNDDGILGVLPHIMGDWLHPNAARRFAAALLAAADAAERSTDV